MSQLGIGAMLYYLGGGSPKNPADYYGRRIAKAEQAFDELRLTFDDGVTVRIFDGGQSCCESRYMHTDDDLGALAGRRLVAIETNAAKTDGFSDPNASEAHEAVFLDVKTEDGVAASFSFHVEHNGCYGGFGLALDEVAR